VSSVRLRELTALDVPIVNAWRQDREITDNLVGAFRYCNLEADEEWFGRYMRARDCNVRLGIVLTEEERLIGVTYLLGIDWIHRTAELGTLIGDKTLWGKGYGSMAERMSLEHAFMDLNLNRVFARIISSNVRAMKAAEKGGFVKEGIQRQHVFKNGRYEDLVMMGITRAEFLSLHGPGLKDD